MEYQIIPADKSMLSSAYGLFLERYNQAQHSNPLLPDLVAPQHEKFQQCVNKALSGGLAVAAIQEDSIVAYMGVSAQFDSRGQRTALIDELSHASVSQNSRHIYQQLYASLAEKLVAQGVHLHIIGHYSHDSEIKAALFQLGFGSLVKERLRDLSDVPKRAEVPIEQEHNWQSIANLGSEHARYYRSSPIFLVKDDSPRAIADDFRQHQQAGDQLFVYREDNEAKAFFIVGHCSGIHEGRLLYGSNTAQVKVAYASSVARGKGIGSALLQRAIGWARESGHDRLFVEHETANLLGASFWGSHFSPFLYFSMRYVDSTL